MAALPPAGALPPGRGRGARSACSATPDPAWPARSCRRPLAGRSVQVSGPPPWVRRRPVSRHP